MDPNGRAQEEEEELKQNQKGAWSTKNIAEDWFQEASPVLWTCTTCSKSMSLWLRSSHLISQEHMKHPKQPEPHPRTWSTISTSPKNQSKTDPAQLESIDTIPETQQPARPIIPKIYCDICKQDYRESKKGPHQSPGWYCEVCDHPMHIISKESHLRGKKHAVQLAAQGHTSG